MGRDLSEDLATLHQHLTDCVNMWGAGYDTGGYQSFIEAIDLMELTVQGHFEQLTGLIQPLTLVLEKLKRFVQHKDIMAVQDVVENEWLPLILEWRGRWTTQ